MCIIRTGNSDSSSRCPAFLSHELGGSEPVIERVSMPSCVGVLGDSFVAEADPCIVPLDFIGNGWYLTEYVEIIMAYVTIFQFPAHKMGWCTWIVGLPETPNCTGPAAKKLTYPLIYTF